MTKQIVRYNIDRLSSYNALINLLYGERSNGKSYQLKHKKAIYHYLETGKRFILMRRLREEIRSFNIEQYFLDVDVAKITDNKYNCIKMYRNKLYFAIYDFDTNKTKMCEHIGYVVALNTEQNYAGSSFLDVDTIIFEEFMTRTTYLIDEPSKLMNFYNTVDRKRGTTRLWLVGNTISRVCPYLEEWDLLDIVRNQKQGEIVVKFVDTGTLDENKEPIYIKMAIEFCQETGNSSYSIGKHKDMMNKGSWQSDPQPHLPKSRKLYNVLFKMYFHYKGFKFACEYLQDKEKYDEQCWFIYPYKKEIPKEKLVFSDIIKTSPYYQKDIYNPLIYNQSLVNLLKTFRLCNICFSDDLTGTDFKQAIDFEIRR